LRRLLAKDGNHDVIKNVTATELDNYCASRIAKYKIPVKFFRTEAFPLTPSGKIRKVALRAMVNEGKLDGLA
jgi:fatty-acyl-CoA synthase